MATLSILVVDDDPAFRTALCRTLRAAGHAVEEAVDGAQALRIMAADTPGLLITDILMPDSDGIELITAVKQAYPALRILAISGRGSFGGLNLLNLAAKLGAHAILAKPFSTDDLAANVAEAMSAANSPGP